MLLRAAGLPAALALVSLTGVACGGGDTSTRAETPTVPAGMTAADLSDLLPTAAEAETALGVPVNESDAQEDLSQTFEHTNTERLVGALVGRYRAAAGSGYVQLALYDTPADAQAAMGVILEGTERDRELRPDAVRSEFDVADMADESRGFVMDAEADSSFTWALLRLDRILVEIVAFHGTDDDQVEGVSRLARLVRENLSSSVDSRPTRRSPVPAATTTSPPATSG